jgi:hypothetical protein
VEGEPKKKRRPARVRLAAARAGERARGAVAASDAFFPFADGLVVAAETGVTAVIQPGGSVRDAEVIAEALGRDLGRVAVYGRQGTPGERKRDEIAILSGRSGDVVGEHTASFGNLGERLELTHRAHTRDTFARGALRAARFIAGAPPGLYSMQDVLALK